MLPRIPTNKMKTIKLHTRNDSTKAVTRKLNPATRTIEFGSIVCKDKDGNIVQTISLTRYAEALCAGAITIC